MGEAIFIGYEHGLLPFIKDSMALEISQRCCFSLINLHASELIIRPETLSSVTTVFTT